MRSSALAIDRDELHNSPIRFKHAALVGALIQ
jgi:hypothetical protein